MKRPRTGWPRPTLVACLIAFAAVILLLAALNVQNGWLYLIDAWTWGLLLGSALYVIPARRQQVTCQFPPAAIEGDPIGVQLTLTSRHPLSYVEVRIAGSQLIVTGDRQVKMTCQLNALPRGIHPMPAPVIVRWSPAGLFWRPEYHPSPGQIRVYPRLAELASWPWLAVTGSQTQDPSQSVREYRSGDPKRWIHWPTSARRDRLFVRECHPNSGNQLTLWLHAPAGSNQGTGLDASLEVAVRSLGSLALFLLEQGWRIWVGSSGQSAWLEIRHRHDLLEWLLPVQESTNTHLPPPMGHQEVIFTLSEDILPQLSERSGKPIVYLCQHQADLSALPPTPFPLVALCAGQSLAQLVQSR